MAAATRAPTSSKEPDRIMQPTQTAFRYSALTAVDEPARVTSVLAYRTIDRRLLRAVMWSDRPEEWIYAPRIVANYLYDLDHQGRTRSTDRTTAEILAWDVLRTELPSEATRLAMCEEGRRMNWPLGPPRQ